MPGKFEVYADKGGRYRYRLKDADGAIVATSPISQSFATPEAAKDRCREVRGELVDATIGDA